MVDCGRERQRYALLGAVAGLAVVCAVAVLATRISSTNLVDKPNALYMDSMNVADKILHAQKFKKANEAQRTSTVKSILAEGHEHKSGKKVVSGVAEIVADTKLTYHQRMEAMKKLLDDQTDAIKSKPLHRVDEPQHAAKKAHSRFRSAEKGHRSKAQEAADNKKAMSEGAKLLAKKGDTHKHDMHTASEHDKQVHKESAHKAADPAKAAAWMKKQLGDKVSSGKKAAAKTVAIAKAATKDSTTAKAAKALVEGEKLIMHETVKHKPAIKHKLHMSAKDEAIKKASETTAADPKAAHKWIANELKAQKAKAVVKKLATQKAAKKSGSSASAASGMHETKSQKLIKWAEAHGLPKKIANNPADKQKVKDIIARMKADLMVEKIKAQFKQDDDKTADIIHGADPSAAAAI